MRNSWVINGNSCLYYKDGKNHRDDGENVCWIGWICRERMLWVKWGVSSGAHWIFWVCTPELYGCAPSSFWECAARTLTVQHGWIRTAARPDSHHKVPPILCTFGGSKTTLWMTKKNTVDKKKKHYSEKYFYLLVQIEKILHSVFLSFWVLKFVSFWVQKWSV